MKDNILEKLKFINDLQDYDETLFNYEHSYYKLIKRIENENKIRKKEIIID